MKLIDDKGRLFGIINIIDLSIMLVVLTLVIGIVVKMGSTPENNGSTNVAQKEYYVTVLCEDVSGKVAENLNEGDRVYYGSAYVNGYIVSAENSPAKETIFLDDGTPKEVEVPNLSDVLVELKVLYDSADNTIMLGAYQVNIGKPLVVKTHRVEVSGIVLDIVEDKGE